MGKEKEERDGIRCCVAMKFVGVKFIDKKGKIEIFYNLYG
jgi:hypothetical protein